MGQSKVAERRLTTESLRYYVPIYQQGDAATRKLLSEGSSLRPGERHLLENLVKLQDLAARRISYLATPLIVREVNKMIATSHLRTRDDIADVLYYAGIDGMKLGLRKFDVDKINQSSTNYLFQWIVTYARKELSVLEAPFGIPPSRFQVYKKISAVRKRLTENEGRTVSNSEILEYFHSGQADLKTMNGRIADRDKPSQANRNITIELIEEQERFEKDMMNVHLIDPQDDYSAAARMSSNDSTVFEETVFGVFSVEYNVSRLARVVIMSELQSSLSNEETELLKSIPPKEYKTLSNQWKNLIKDRNGPFYKFLLDHKDEQFEQFDVESTIRAIESYNKSINSSLYRILFEGNKVMKR